MAFPYDNRGFMGGFGQTTGGTAGFGNPFAGLEYPTAPSTPTGPQTGRGASQGGGTTTGDVASGVTGNAGRGAAGGGGTGTGGTGQRGDSQGGVTGPTIDTSYNPVPPDPYIQNNIWSRQGFGSLADWRNQAFRVNQNPMTNQGWFNPAAMGGYNPQYGYGANQYMNPMWAAMRNQPGYAGNPGAAGGPAMPGGWTMQKERDGSTVYNQPNGNYWVRFNPRFGWYDSRNPMAGFTWNNPFAQAQSQVQGPAGATNAPTT